MSDTMSAEARMALKQARKRAWEDYAAANNLETTPGASFRQGTIKTRDGRTFHYINGKVVEAEADPYKLDVTKLSPEEKQRYKKMSAEERQRYNFHAAKDAELKGQSGYDSKWRGMQGTFENDAAREKAFLEAQRAARQDDYNAYAQKRAAARQAALNARRYEQDYLQGHPGVELGNFVKGFLSDSNVKNIIDAIRPAYGQ